MIRQKEILLKLSLLGSNSEGDREQVNQDVGCFFLKHHLKTKENPNCRVTGPSPPHRHEDQSLGGAWVHSPTPSCVNEKTEVQGGLRDSLK